MTVILSFFLTALVFAALPDVAEEAQIVTVQIKRFGVEELQQVAWDVRGVTVDGSRVWDTLLAHHCHGPDALAGSLTLEDEEFVPDVGLDRVLEMFTQALKSGKGISSLGGERLDRDLPSGRIGRADVGYFKAEKWYWWSGMTWDLLSYFKNRPLASGHVWLTLNSQMITIEGYKAFGRLCTR